MREIKIRSIKKDKIYHLVRLGNGTIHRFDSQKKAKKFLADTNRFLSEKLLQLNIVLADLYSHGREVWIITDEVSSRNIGDRIQMLEHFLKQSQLRSEYKEGNLFAFIDLTKFCFHSKELIKYFTRVTYIQKTDTLRRHKLNLLYDQINALHTELIIYGQREAFELFETNHLETISDYSHATQLQIA